MANLSELTRKEQVLAHLRAHRNQWVDGPELAPETVGGSEGLRRLRELRLSGDHDIRERRHPDPNRDIWQYMLVVMEQITPRSIDRASFDLPPPIWVASDQDVVNDATAEYLSQILDLSEALEDAKPIYPDHSTEAARREEDALPPPLDIPTENESPWPADHDQTPIREAVRRKEDGTFEYVPPQRALIGEQLTTPPDPPQPDGAKFSRMPTKLVWGEMAICPRCRQKTVRGRKPKPKKDEGLVPEHIRQRKAKAAAKEGPTLIDEWGVLLYRDPTSTKPKPCERCNGYGIVPNRGPISITLP
jgi:hypothetical protein